ncbi:MAG TPA: cupin domain-containing protein [Candidatus Deferrimicrobiaceae bacterium]|nr:cupin domain-containing protein [Candidatus Deferrimicrobiaceae bacterium]
MIDIGARIRHLRQINGLSQADLAERAGLTKGAISQIERNMTSPAVANLLEILSALSETPSSFFAEDDEEKVLFRKNDSLPSDVTGYLTFDNLLPKSRYRTVTAYRAVIRPGREALPEPAHEGENYVFILSGRLDLRMGKVTYIARKGESLYFRAEQEYSFSNRGKRPVDFLWVKASGR